MSNSKSTKKNLTSNGEPPKFMNVGFGNVVSLSRVIAIISPESAPVKRLIQISKENTMLIDATCGRKTRAVIVMDSNHIILSAMLPETVANRMVVSKGEVLDDPTV